MKRIITDYRVLIGHSPEDIEGKVKSLLSSSEWEPCGCLKIIIDVNGHLIYCREMVRIREI